MNVRLRILLVSALSIAPMASLVLYGERQARKRAGEAVVAEAVRTARTIAADQQRLGESAAQLVELLRELPEVRAADTARCNELFENLLRANPRYANMGLAAPDGELTASGVPMSKAVNIADRDYFQRAMKGESPAVGEFAIGRLTGKPVVTMGTRVKDPQGGTAGVVFVSLDLEWVSQFAAGQAPEEAMITVWNADGMILVCHPDPDSRMGKTYADAPVLKAIRASKGEGTTEAEGVDGVLRLYAFTKLSGRGSNGDVHVSVGFPVDRAYAPIEEDRRRSLLALGAVSILALLGAWFGGGGSVAKITEEAQRLAATDPLTGLANRRRFAEDAEREIRRARRFDSALSLLMVDIDHFKKVNDSHGHLAGDAVLTEVARVCKESVRDLDLVGRYGGEEFVILLLESSPETLRATAERLRLTVERTPVSFGGQELKVTISIGGAHLMPETQDLETLVHCADQAMYAAKQNGRNRLEIF